MRVEGTNALLRKMARHGQLVHHSPLPIACRSRCWTDKLRMAVQSAGCLVISPTVRRSAETETSGFGDNAIGTAI